MRNMKGLSAEDLRQLVAHGTETEKMLAASCLLYGTAPKSPSPAQPAQLKPTPGGVVFTKATKKKAKLRFAFDGPAGSGKTYSSLLLARGLGGRTAVIDTEHGSASKYAHLFDFDTVELSEFSLDTYLKTIAAAKSAGYDVLVVDSLSHAWTGKGGALEEVDRVGGSNKFTNGWRAVTPKHNQLVDALLAYPGHVVCTMRTKMEYVVEEINGKKVPRKVGMAPVQREGMEYEFDVVCDLGIGGDVSISKTRCSELSGNAGLLKHADVPAMAQTLKAWLSDGAEAPAARPTPPPVQNGARPAVLASVSRQPDMPEPPPPSDEWAPTASTAPEETTTAAKEPSEEEQIIIAIGEAQAQADLDRLVPRIQRLPKPAQDRVRPIWNAKKRQLVKEASNAV